MASSGGGGSTLTDEASYTNNGEAQSFVHYLYFPVHIYMNSVSTVLRAVMIRTALCFDSRKFIQDFLMAMLKSDKTVNLLQKLSIYIECPNIIVRYDANNDQQAFLQEFYSKMQAYAEE